MSRAKRLVVFALSGYILMDLGMRVYVFGPSFYNRWWYGFTEGGSITVTQRAGMAMGSPWQNLKRHIERMSPSIHGPPRRWHFLNKFRSLQWRLDSLDPIIRDAALSDLDRAGPKVKVRVARFIGERISKTDPQPFYRDLRVLERLGPFSGAALPAILGHYSKMDPHFQMSLQGWFGSLKSEARPVLPFLWEELNGLENMEIHFFTLACGTPPLPEYLSYELSRAAGVIHAILAIDPLSRDVLISKLRTIKKIGRKDLQYFCDREIAKITIPNQRVRGDDPRPTLSPESPGESLPSASDPNNIK